MGGGGSWIYQALAVSYIVGVVGLGEPVGALCIFAATLAPSSCRSPAC
jgi:MHS family metabolite:H+ symporter-like MFS transporter